MRHKKLSKLFYLLISIESDLGIFIEGIYINYVNLNI